MRAIHFFLIFSLIFNSPFSFAAETSSGGKSPSTTNRKPSSSASAESDVQLKKGKCPTPLKESVLDDYQDKSTLIVFDFKSEAKTCNTSVTAYQNFMSGKGVQTNYQTPDALSAELSKQFATTISPNMARTLNGCNSSPDMTPEQAKVAHTRFYAAATRIEKFNKSAVDELAYIDSITEGGGVLEGIECSPLLPELKANCESLRNAGLQCKGNTAERFEEQVQKTTDNIAKIEALKTAEDKCKLSVMVKCAGGTADCPSRGGFTKASQKTAEKKCENIAKAIELLRDEVPWIRGEIFDKIAREKAKPRSSTRNYLSREKIKEGLREQLKANRTALATAYKDNLQNFRCLMYDTNDKGEKCDFAKVRTELAKLDAPKIPQLQDRRANMELKTYFDAESCLLDRGEDRASTKDIVDNSARDAGLTVLTAGLGSIAVGAKVIGGLSKTAIYGRRGAFAGALAVDGYYAQGSSRDAFKSCTQKSAPILDNLSVRDKQKNMVCDNAKSQVSIAKDVNTSCAVDALLAGADLLPFLGGAAPLLARAVKTLPSTGSATPGGGLPPGGSPLPNAPKVDVAATVKPDVVATAEKPKPRKQKVAQNAGGETSTTPPVTAGKPADSSKPKTEVETSVAETAVTREVAIPPVQVTVTKTGTDEVIAVTQTPEIKVQRRIGPNDNASSNPDLTAENPNLTAAQKVLLGGLEPVPVNSSINTGSNQVAGGKIATNSDAATAAVGTLIRKDPAAGKVNPNDVANAAAIEGAARWRGQRVRMANADGGTVAADITSLRATDTGAAEIEVAYTRADGSMSSKRMLAAEFFSANPNPRMQKELDDQFFQFISGKKRNEVDLLAQRKAPVLQQTNTTTQSFAVEPRSAALDMRNSNINSAMAAAAAPSNPAQSFKAAVNQPIVAQRTQELNLQPEVQSFNNAAPVVNVQTRSRSPASTVNAVQAAPAVRSAEDDLVQALTRNNTGAVAPTMGFGKAKQDPGSMFKSNGGGSSNSGINLKADNTPTTYVDTSDNVRFVEGEQIKIANFENGKDAEFKIVKKLDNGLLRVSDSSGKEFDLLRDEVKTAQRLNPTMSPSAMAVPTPAKIKGWTNEIVTDVKVKESLVRQGDKVIVKNFEGGADLNASVVRKNTDGTVRVKDEAGKEFDLIKSEVKDAEFSRGLTAEVKQNLEIGDEAARLKAAEDYLQRPMNDTQKIAVIKSHKIAEEKGIFSLSTTDLRQKTKVLREAGFSEDEASLLIRKGVTGSTGFDSVKIVADQPAVPKFEIAKGQKLEVPMGNTGRTNPGSVMSGPDARGFYEVEFFQSGAGIGRTRKTAAELTAANVKLPGKVENPMINVPAVGKDVSYPGKVISGPNAKGQFEVEIYPPGKPATLTRIDGNELKKANTPQAIRQAKIRDARRASFADRSSAELEQILDDSLRQADSRGSRDIYNVSYGSSGKPDKALKTKKIDIEGQRALEALAKRQNKDVNELYEEIKLSRQTKPAVVGSTNSKSSTIDSQSDVYNSPQAGGARNELDYLAEQDGLTGARLNDNQRESFARELGITDNNRISAMDYKAVASRKETRQLFDKVFPNEKGFDADLLRQSMSFNPRSGFVGAREFSNAEKFVDAVQRADLSQLNVSERRLLNKFTDRAPLYARQGNADIPLLPRQNVELDANSVRKIASTDQPSVAAFSSPAIKDIDPVEVAGDARNRLDYLAQQDRLNSSRLTERQRESVARELGIYDANKTAALDYGSVASKKEARDLFEKIFPGKKEFDPEMLRSSMSFNPRGGYIGNAEFVNAEKFVNAVKKADIDGSTLSLSERRLLNKFTDRAPLYARQVNAEAPAIARQSLEAVVPPRITNNKISTFAARGDEVVADVKIKPEVARPGDKVIVKDFEGGADLSASFVRKNSDGTIRVKDSQGKEINLGAQATGDSQFYRGLTAELKVNGSLDNPSRVKAAEEYVKRPLTETQKNAVIASHNVGGEGRGYFDYTAKELKEKTEILRKAGFSNSEATLLIRKGVTGNNPTEISNLIKVTPDEVRVGDNVVINEFNGTGELRGQITGSANNGGLVLREANGTETVIYKADLDNLSNSQITRNPNLRTIAAAEDLDLERAPIIAQPSKKTVPVEAKDVRTGDRVLISNFDGAGELEGVIVESKKTGGYLLREANGREVVLYKADLEDVSNTKISREWGVKPPTKKGETAVIDNSPDSTLLVANGKKANPDIAVPLGNGEIRQGRVLSQVEAAPGLPKSYVVEYVDEVGVTSQVRLTQDELLSAQNPEALKRVKADRERSLQYQSKSDKELHQMLDEGNRAAKEAVGKGRAVDKPDLSAETQSALSELARRNSATSSSIFDIYRRGGVKGLETQTVVKKIMDSSPSEIPAVPLNSKPLSEMKAGDFVVTAGFGDKVKVPGSQNEAIVLARKKIDGEAVYALGIKNADGTATVKRVTERELGDVNPSFVSVKLERSFSADPKSVREKIEADFKKGRDETELAELRRKSRKKIEDKNKVVYDDVKNPMLTGRAGAATPEGDIYINIDRDTDQRFSTLLHEVSHTKTDVKKGDLAINSPTGNLNGDYKDRFSLDEIKAATINFAADKQTVIAQSKAGKPGIANKAVKRDIRSMQSSVERRQNFISDARNSLDKIDESMSTLKLSKTNLDKNGEKVSFWQIRLDNVEGLDKAPVYVTFVTPVNASRNEAVTMLREFSRAEKVNLLNAQARLDYDKIYLSELRNKVGVPKPPAPLNGPSALQIVSAKGVPRNPGSDLSNAQIVEAKSTKQLVEELDGVIGVRGRSLGLRSTAELTTGHPLTPVIEKQSQIINRLNKIDRDLEPENFAGISSNVANEFLKSGDVDLALPYYRAAADTIESSLGTTAKAFWASEENTKAAIKAGFLSDNQELAQMATQKSVLAKTKGNTVEEVKKVALDQFYNLGYEYDKLVYGIKRYGNKNKELDLLVIRKQQQHIANKYGLTKEIEASIGKDKFELIDNQADLIVDEILKDPARVIDPDKFKKTQRVPAS